MKTIQGDWRAGSSGQIVRIIPREYLDRRQDFRNVEVIVYNHASGLVAMTGISLHRMSNHSLKVKVSDAKMDEHVLTFTAVYKDQNASVDADDENYQLVFTKRPLYGHDNEIRTTLDRVIPR